MKFSFIFSGLLFSTCLPILQIHAYPTSSSPSMITPIDSHTSSSSFSTIYPVDPRIHWTGRTRINLDQTISFNWEGVSFLFTVQNTTEVFMSLALPTNIMLKFRVYINNNDFGVFYPNYTSTEYSIVSGLDPSESYIIRVYNAVEPRASVMDSDVSFVSSLQDIPILDYPTLLSISTDGIFIPLAQPGILSRKIQLIGDSITAGYGVDGTAPCPESILMFDNSYTYGHLLATNFSAELVGIQAWSGKGIYVNCCDDLPTMATMALQLFANQTSTVTNWDFNNPSRPDITIIALGTNDYAFNRSVNNATFVQNFVNAYVDFIYQLTQYHYSNYTTVFLGLGPITDSYGPALVEIMNICRTNYSIPVYILNFTGAPLTGCNNHPNKTGHQIMFEMAQPQIAEIMGWKTDTKPVQPIPLPSTIQPPRSLGKRIYPASYSVSPFAAFHSNQDITYYVRSDGTGNFTSIQAALNYCNSTTNTLLGHVTLHIQGYFWERVTIVSTFTNGVTIIGDGPNSTDNFIMYNMSASETPFATWDSQTVMVQASNVTFINIAIGNNANNYNSNIAGQSVALHLDATANYFSCWYCTLYGAQDTLYTGPSGYNLKSYFYKNYINGSTDCIFGGSSSVFDQNTIDMEVTVTAPRGDPESAYLFTDCTVTTQSSLQFGRPWGQLSAVVFKNTYLGPGIDPAGWDDWSHGCTNKETPWWCAPLVFAEYNSTGPGANPSQRVWWSKQLTPTEAALWNMTGVLKGWIPMQTISNEAQQKILSITNPVSSVSSTVSIAVPSTVFDVKSYGAIGDGMHNDTDAIQACINAAIASSPGYATILFSGPSSIYLSWPLLIANSNNLVIQFAQGATLLAANYTQWPSDPSHWPYGQSFLYLNGGNNLTIIGAGQYEVAINGQGEAWWNAYSKNHAPRPTFFVSFNNINTILVSELRYINSPNFHLVFNNCENIVIDTISIYATPGSPNTDGVDAGHCNNVTLRNSNITNGDDSFAVKPGTNNTVIENCYFAYGHGASVGSLGENGDDSIVENVYVRNVTFYQTMGAAKVKAWQGGKGYARNMTWTNLTFISVQTPIQFTQFYCPHDPQGCIPQNTTVAIMDLTVTDAYGTQSDGNAVQVNCTKAFPCTDIVLKNVNITSDKGPKGQNLFTCSNAYGTATNVYPASCLQPSEKN